MQSAGNTPAAAPTPPTLTPQQEVVLATAVARLEAAIGAGIVEHPQRRWERRHVRLNNPAPTSSTSNNNLHAYIHGCVNTNAAPTEAPTEAPAEAPARADVPMSLGVDGLVYRLV